MFEFGERMARMTYWFSTILLAAGLAGCASFIDRNLVPGVSNQGDAEKYVGSPTAKLSRADGGATWYYSRQPFGRQTWALHFDTAGTLATIDQVLDRDHLAKVTVGKTTAAEVRSILGPPYRIARMPRQKQDSWEYWMTIDSIPVHVFIQIADDGMVREIVKSEDLSLDPGRWD